MKFDIQKASLLKRASAWLFDLILLGILAVGFAWLLSIATGYDSYTATLEAAYARIEAEYGIDMDIGYADYSALDEAGIAAYQAAYDALSADGTAMHAYSMQLSLTLLITSLGILFAYLALELVVPLILGNGQTLGKKIFSVALMRVDGVKLSTFQLFVRTVLGKYTIETMIPVFIGIMLWFGSIGIVGIAVLLGIVILEIALLAATANKSLLHDLLAVTVAVDMQSQLIFDTPEALLEYKQRKHAEASARSPY